MKVQENAQSANFCFLNFLLTNLLSAEKDIQHAWDFPRWWAVFLQHLDILPSISFFFNYHHAFGKAHYHLFWQDVDKYPPPVCSQRLKFLVSMPQFLQDWWLAPTECTFYITHKMHFYLRMSIIHMKLITRFHFFPNDLHFWVCMFIICAYGSMCHGIPRHEKLMHRIYSFTVYLRVIWASNSLFNLSSRQVSHASDVMWFSIESYLDLLQISFTRIYTLCIHMF